MKKISAWHVAAILTLSFAQISWADTLADWTFETSVPATAGPFAPESLSEILSASASGHHAGSTAVYSTPAGNGSAHSYSANVWASGDYFQFTANLDLTDYTYSGFNVTFDQNGSSTGPGTFAFEYSTDGTTFNKLGSDYTLTSGITWASTATTQPTQESFNLSSVTGLNTASTVYFRVVDDGTTSIAGGTIGTAGSDRVDNFIISSVVTPTSTPEPTTLALAAVGGIACLFVARRRK